MKRMFGLFAFPAATVTTTAAATPVMNDDDMLTAVDHAGDAATPIE
jgi:hypothetical protein